MRLIFPTDIWFLKNRTRWEGCDNGKGAVPRKLGGQKEMRLKDGEREIERVRVNVLLEWYELKKKTIIPFLKSKGMYD